VAVLCGLPESIYRDSENRLHSTETAAISWKDGYELSFYHGRCVPNHWITHPEDITKDEVIRESNVEKRWALFELLGEHRFAELLDLKVVDEHVEGTLLRTREKDPSTDDYLQFLRVIDPSTSQPYHISMPLINPLTGLELKSAPEARALSFQFREGEFKPEVET
jgi:hypothetical protein